MYSVIFVSCQLYKVSDSVEETEPWRKAVIICIFTFDLAVMLAFAGMGWLVVKTGETEHYCPATAPTNNTMLIQLDVSKQILEIPQNETLAF